MQDLLQLQDEVRYCSNCDYVLPADLWKVSLIHINQCQIIAMGGDCMHFEGKTTCECA